MLCTVAMLLLLFVGSPETALASAGDEMFADGNRLFRDDLYWAALLRYQQASEAGLDSPLLHYNTGIAHYKAEQYIRAHKYLVNAARSDKLRAVSHYNLGLNAWALGDTDEALSWFRKARNQQQSAHIQSLAGKAILRLKTR